jgi:3-methyladenine DNA glycosylase AlkC
MGELLKHFFSPALVKRLAADVARVHPAFPSRRFVARATKGLDQLELLDRGRHISTALADALPEDYEQALAVLVRSLGQEHATDELVGAGMAPFYYLPHVIFVAERGLHHFDASMRAQVELTKRFSAEASIRPYIAKDPERAFEYLRRWAKHDNAHVRRLVSEGTRLRLPWAPRVAWLDANPGRVVELLDLLKDDPATLVRRSVANNVNDLSKVWPDVAFDVCARWLADDARRPLVEHSMRSAVKRGEPRALALLGFGKKPDVELTDVRFEPRVVRIGEKVRVSFAIENTGRSSRDLLVDLRVHFVKAGGATSPKVFKVARLSLGRGERASLQKSISLQVHTTRTPRPGKHAVEVMVNGRVMDAGAFEVRA